MAVLTALLAMLLSWLLPFPERPLGLQLSRWADREALKARLGAAPAIPTYLQTVRRFDEWLMEWFGSAFSVQAFERCVAIAFLFPIALFVINLAASGVVKDRIGFAQLGLFLLVFAGFCYVMAVGFRNLLSAIRLAWMRFGGDGELAQTISRLLLGAFAVMVAFTIAFAIAATFSGQVSNASSVLGSMAGGFVLAFAFAIAFALAGGMLFSIVIVLLAGIALALASDFTMLLILFFVTLPAVNACADWLSWGTTRYLIGRAASAGPGPGGALRAGGAVLGTFASGAALMMLLAMLLPNALELLNMLFGLAKLPPFDWQALAQRSVAAPWSEGLFVTGMLMTPLVPACAHLIVSSAGVLSRFTPGSAAAIAGISDHPDVALKDDEARRMKVALLLARGWYLAGAALAAGVIALAVWLASMAHLPIASFLSGLARCSTAWSHGQCGFF
jgi:hypothetical protein